MDNIYFKPTKENGEIDLEILVHQFNHYNQIKIGKKIPNLVDNRKRKYNDQEVAQILSDKIYNGKNKYPKLKSETILKYYQKNS